MDAEFIDAFSGGGGAALGYEQAGLRHLLGIDNDPVCIATLKRNRRRAVLADLSSETLTAVLVRNGIGKQFAGLLHLSPPCQGVSSSGPKAGVADKRNKLLFTVSDACRDYPSATIVMENVRGLLQGNALPIFRTLIAMILETKRNPVPHLLQALDYGLAQHRERLFLVCPPVGETCPPLPRGTWHGLEPKTLFESIHPTTGFVDSDPEPVLMSVNEICMGVQEIYLDSWRGRLYAAELYRQRRRENKVGWRMLRNTAFLGRLNWSKYAPSVIAGMPHPGSRADKAHPDEPRYLTNGECRELQGIPHEYVFAGDLIQRRRQIGNAVPPPFTKAIGQCLVSSTLNSLSVNDGAVSDFLMSSEIAKNACIRIKTPIDNKILEDKALKENIHIQNNDIVCRDFVVRGRRIIKFVGDDQGIILRDIVNLHCGGEIDCDPTYSIGNFYKKTGVPEPKYKFDLNPQAENVVKADSRDLPLADESISSIIFDPPFITGCADNGRIGKRFSCMKDMKVLWAYYFDTMKEFHRILKSNGILVFKCQDGVSGGKNFFSHCNIINQALQIGYYPKDLFVLIKNVRMIQHNLKCQQHARKFHSYFLVFEKTKSKVVYSPCIDPFSGAGASQNSVKFQTGWNESPKLRLRTLYTVLNPTLTAEICPVQPCRPKFDES